MNGGIAFGGGARIASLQAETERLLKAGAHRSRPSSELTGSVDNAHGKWGTPGPMFVADDATDCPRKDHSVADHTSTLVLPAVSSGPPPHRRSGGAPRMDPCDRSAAFSSAGPIPLDPEATAKRCPAHVGLE